MIKISFGAGCFWGVEHAFKQIDGVTRATAGYQGGKNENPTYEQICRGDTEHAEVVEVEFDESIVTLEKILRAFWLMHDPTQVNKQGPDTGTQYRTVIFYYDESLVEQINGSLKTEQTKYTNPIATKVQPAPEFFNAEDYHQDYLEKTPGGYCHIGLDIFQKLKQGDF